jgi:hypothetical protein
MIKIEGSERELQALLVLLDAAVRGAGLRGAGDACIWAQRIEEALRGASNGQMATDSEALHPRN